VTCHAKTQHQWWASYFQKVTSVDKVRWMGWNRRRKLSVADRPWVIVLKVIRCQKSLLQKDTTGIQPDRDRDASGQTHKWTGHKWTGTGTETDRDRDTVRQRHRLTRTGTQTDRKRDTDGQRERQGHRRTGTRTEPDMDSDRNRNTYGQGHRWTDQGHKRIRTRI
jgi:hypothetical protein